MLDERTAYSNSIDPEEVAFYTKLAETWWDKQVDQVRAGDGEAREAGQVNPFAFLGIRLKTTRSTSAVLGTAKSEP